MTTTEVLAPEEQLIDTSKTIIEESKSKEFDSVEQEIEFNDQIRSVTKIVLKRCCDANLTRKINARLNRLKLKMRLNDTLAHYKILRIVLEHYRNLSYDTTDRLQGIFDVFEARLSVIKN